MCWRATIRQKRALISNMGFERDSPSFQFHISVRKTHTNSGGKVFKFIDRSYVCPTLHNNCSDKCFPMNWMLNGNPSVLNPEGMEIVGDPLKSNGTVNRPHSEFSSRNLGPYICSSVMGKGGEVMVGQQITSIFSKILFKRPLQEERILFALAYSTPVTAAPFSNHP